MRAHARCAAARSSAPPAARWSSPASSPPTSTPCRRTRAASSPPTAPRLPPTAPDAGRRGGARLPPRLDRRRGRAARSRRRSTCSARTRTPSTCSSCNTGHTAAPIRSRSDAPWSRDRRTARSRRAHPRLRRLRRPARWNWTRDTGEAFAADASRGGGWEIRTSLPRLGSRLFVIPEARPAEAACRAARAARPCAQRRSDRRGVGRHALRSQRAGARPPALPHRQAASGRPADGDPARRPRGARSARHARRGGAHGAAWAATKPPSPSARPSSWPTFDVAGPAQRRAVAGARAARHVPASPSTARRSAPTADGGWWVDRVAADAAARSRRCSASAQRAHADVRLRRGPSGPGDRLPAGRLRRRGSRARASTLDAPPRAAASSATGCTQGLPFYAGSVGYCRRSVRACSRGSGCSSRCPSTAARRCACWSTASRPASSPGSRTRWTSPTCVTATGTAASELAIEVIGHRRNSHGPLHYCDRNGPAGPAPASSSPRRAMDATTTNWSLRPDVRTEGGG